MSTNTDLSTEFTGRRALVTGGTKGIGAAIAQRLLDGGAQVVEASRSRTDTTPSGATFIAGDVSTVDGAAALAQAALAELGGLDILINNAGAARADLGGATAVTDPEWLDSLNINLLAAVRVTNALVPALKQSPAAAIVNISSGGSSPMPGPLVHYGAAKAALNAYTAILALELGPQGIRVNNVTPGPVRTDRADELRQQFTDALGAPADAMLTSVAMRRLGEPHEVAEVVALLVSDRGQWITSANYMVDGGFGAL